MSIAITYLDLFAGLGAFAKGLLDAGYRFKHHYYSEIEKYALANYRYNFKSADYVEAVETIKQQKNIVRPDLITFGSPCQDLSIAGHQTGLKGDQSKLFFDAIDIIDRFRPKVFVFENVKGLLFSHQSKDFEIVLRAIANLGLYECQWQLVNTAWFLPQNRERIFLIGTLRESGTPQVFPLTSGYQEDPVRLRRINVVGRAKGGQTGRVYHPDGCSPTLMNGNGYVNGFVKVGGKIRRLTPIECERLQGLPDDWTRYGIFDNEIRELSDNQRYQLTGNAITATVMEKIAVRLKPVFDSGLNGISKSIIEQKAIELYNELNKYGKEGS